MIGSVFIKPGNQPMEVALALAAKTYGPILQTEAAPNGWTRIYFRMGDGQPLSSLAEELRLVQHPPPSCPVARHERRKKLAMARHKTKPGRRRH